MKAIMQATQQWYHDIIATDDSTQREELYRQRFIEPWQPMINAVNGGQDNTDPLKFAGQAFEWLLPDDLTTIPASLTALENANAWSVTQQALDKAIESLAPYADHIPIGTIHGWLMLANPAMDDPIKRGYTGATDWMNPQFVVQYYNVNDYNLPRLQGITVHEMHHLIRNVLFPWHNIMQVTVGEYVVHEGLAESFASALFGDDIVGYYVTEFDEQQLETAYNLIKADYQQTGFDVVRTYIFGDRIAQSWSGKQIGMPDYGGYAIGYRIVQAYLQKTGNTVQQATFVPAATIIAESGYFE